MDVELHRPRVHVVCRKQTDYQCGDLTYEVANGAFLLLLDITWNPGRLFGNKRWGGADPYKYTRMRIVEHYSTPNATFERAKLSALLGVAKAFQEA
jgi:hypothetical protein